MAVALTDQVRVYHLLHEEFRQFHCYEIKNVKKIRFSSGGQFLVVADHKKMFIFHTYSLEKIKDISCPSQSISNLAFNYDDSEMTFVSSDGMLQNFDLMEFSKIGETRILRNSNYRSACFLSTPQDSESKVITVGQEKDVGGSLKIFNTAS